MAVIKSRRNGLKIFIPHDARGVVQRFAVPGGDNQLVFEPIGKGEVNRSKEAEKEPVSLDGMKVDTEELKETGKKAAKKPSK